MINIPSAEKLKAENKKIETDYKMNLKEELSYLIEEITCPGQYSWEMNFLTRTKDSPSTKLTRVILEELKKELESIGYNVSFDDRIFKWSIDEI